MTKEIDLAKQHGIQYRMTPEGTTEMWCHDRNLQAFAEDLVAKERERNRPLINQCRAAFAEELSAWDIDPPLHHVFAAHAACVEWLAPPEPAKG